MAAGIEIAKRIRVARRHYETRHLVRVLLIGLYTGTRPGALLKLRWMASTDGGWVDLQGGVIHRRGRLAAHTKKRQPPVRIHRRLLPHLRRWHHEDAARGLTHVVHYAGKSIRNIDSAWHRVRKAAGVERRDSPHVLRHSAATLFMQAGVDVVVVAGFLGMSIEVLRNVYGHHHPMFQHAIAQVTPKKQTN